MGKCQETDYVEQKRKKSKVKRRYKNKVLLEDFEISCAHSNNKIQV